MSVEDSLGQAVSVQFCCKFSCVLALFISTNSGLQANIVSSDW